MSKLKFSLVFIFVLLATIPVGLANAQVPVLISAQEATGSGTAVIWDSLALSDAITYTMSGVSLPGSDAAYEGWLVTDDGSTKLSTGVMEVSIDGSIDHTYTSPGGENLIETYDKVVITLEPVPDDDADAPSDVIMYSDQIPTAGLTHIRHLLVAWPEGEAKGILTNLREQLDLAIEHANLAAASDTIEDVQLHTHQVINIIEGEGGENFDASIENPGDGTGVLTHAQDRQHGPFAASAAAGDAEIVAGGAAVDIDGKNAADWALEARDIALNNVLSTSNVALAKVFLTGADSVAGMLEAARDGFDADADGTVESIDGEGGAEQAYVEAQRMATYTLTAAGAVSGVGAPSTPAGPSIGLPSVGDSTIPLLAQIGLIAAIALLVSGGVLVFRGRRSTPRG